MAERPLLSRSVNCTTSLITASVVEQLVRVDVDTHVEKTTVRSNGFPTMAPSVVVGAATAAVAEEELDTLWIVVNKSVEGVHVEQVKATCWPTSSGTKVPVGAVRVDEPAVAVTELGRPVQAT